MSEGMDVTTVVSVGKRLGVEGTTVAVLWGVAAATMAACKASEGELM